MDIPSSELPFYRKTIFPNRSLTRRGALVVMAGAIVAVAVMSAVLLRIGAWPILPFVFGSFAAISAMLYGIALHRDDFELLIIDDANFHILRRCGRDHSWHRFQRYWARVYFEPAQRSQPARLYIRSHGRALEIGSHLDEPRRRILARELGNVLGHPARGA